MWWSVRLNRHALRNIRERSGYSQADLADHCIGISRSMLCRLENGERNASPSTIQTLAAVLGVPLHALLGPEDPKETS